MKSKTYQLPESLPKTLDYWETELWQIIRYHNGHIEIKIDFSPAYGVPFYRLYILKRDRYLDKPYGIFLTSGTNLWKRYKKAVLFLIKMYGDKVHVYEP